MDSADSFNIAQLNSSVVHRPLMTRIAMNTPSAVCLFDLLSYSQRLQRRTSNKRESHVSWNRLRIFSSLLSFWKSRQASVHLYSNERESQHAEKFPSMTRAMWWLIINCSENFPRQVPLKQVLLLRRTLIFVLSDSLSRQARKENKSKPVFLFLLCEWQWACAAAKLFI